MGINPQHLATTDARAQKDILVIVAAVGRTTAAIGYKTTEGMMNTKVTRITTVGYAVNTSPTHGENGYRFELPTKPMWTGTINTVSEALREDRYYNSLTNIYYSEAWFVKVNGTWMRVVSKDEFDSQTRMLYIPVEYGYLEDEVEVEVDYPTEASRAAAALRALPSEKRSAVSRENGKKHGRKPLKVASE